MKIVIAAFLTLFLSACAMHSSNGLFVHYQGEQILSEQAAKTLPREERINAISADMKRVGFSSIRVSYLFDTFSDTVLDIYSNQFELMKEYKSLLDHHKDVTSFLMANQNKIEQELELAILEFDKTAATEEQKIGPKLTAYESATDEIWQENAKLSVQIAAQALELGVVFYSLYNEDRKNKEKNKKENSNKNTNNLENFIAADLLNMLSSASKMSKAYDLAEVRLHLAKVANDFIKDEQAVIDISKELQRYQNAQ